MNREAPEHSGGVPASMRIEPSDVRRPAATTSSSTASSAPAVERSEAGATVSAEAPASPTTTGRLQTLRALIDQGNYPVDLDRLASRIAEDELLRGGRS